jgi:exonuclease III
VATLNINSIRNKFEHLKILIIGNIDILVITETKLDDTFSETSFMIEGFSKPYRRDRNSNGGGILIYVREDIPSKELKQHSFPDDIEGIFVEINLRTSKWLLFGTYHPPNQSDEYYFNKVSNSLDMYMTKYDKFLLTGDFNSEDSEPELAEFLQKYGARNIQKESTCFKSIENPSCIDLFLTNSNLSFQNTTVLATGLSDFHKMGLNALEISFAKCMPKEIIYRNYKKFDNEVFNAKLNAAVCHGCKYYGEFENIFVNFLNELAPLKKKIIRANHAPYMTKSLRKAIMRRSQLQTKYYKTKNANDYTLFKKQRNFVSKMYKKEKKIFYKNLDIRKVLDNKTFWKYMKPVLSGKSTCNPKITLVVGDSIITEDTLLAETFNSFFKDAVENLEITENRLLLDRINVSACADPVDIVIEKYKNHPSILKIKQEVQTNKEFNFTEVSLEMIEKEIKKLNTGKATKLGDIPSRLVKENINIFGPEMTKFMNNCFSDNEFPDELKLADVSPIFKKDITTDVKNYRPISILPTN